MPCKNIFHHLPLGMLEGLLCQMRSYDFCLFMRFRSTKYLGLDGLQGHRPRLKLDEYVEITLWTKDKPHFLKSPDDQGEFPFHRLLEGQPMVISSAALPSLTNFISSPLCPNSITSFLLWLELNLSRNRKLQGYLHLGLAFLQGVAER